MTRCTVECTTIPDGFASTDHSSLRVSIVLRPAATDPVPPRVLPAVDLSQWPTEMPAWSFQVWAGPSKAALTPVATVPASAAFEDSLTPAITPHAQAWWNKLWQRPGDLDAYFSLLTGSGGAVPSNPEALVTGYEYSRLHQGAIRSAHEEFLLAAASYISQQKVQDLSAEFEGVALRAARDPNDPMARIVRTLRSLPLSSPALAETDGAAAVGPTADAAGPPRRRGTLHPDFARALNPWVPGILPGTDGGSTMAATTPLDRTAKANDDNFEAAMRTDAELVEKGAIPDALPSGNDHAHQVAGTLRAHPALRKFARQIADITVSVAALRAAFPAGATDVTGVIVVEAIPPGAAAAATPSKDALYTAFLLRTGASALFEPCPETAFPGSSPPAHAVGASLPLRDGFVEPEEYQGQRRFQIASIDGIAAYYARKRSEEATGQAYRQGAMIKDVPTEPTGFRTRGLMLLDLAAQDAATAAEGRQTSIDKDHLLFAEDLVDGYRVDVVAPRGDVFPTCARKVTYSALNTLAENLRELYQTERNDGFVSPLARTWTMPSATAGQPAQRHLSVSQVVLTWTGRPLGLPSGEGAGTETGIIADLEASYSFDESRPGPILRLFGHYRFMLRARKLNGSSVPSSAGRVGEFCLGSQDDKFGRMRMTAGRSPSDPGYQFGFVEKAPAPTLLVPESFVAGTGVDPGVRENISRVIVLTGSAEVKVRWLASPLLGFDLAEMQGQFDPVSAMTSDREKAAARARCGAYRYLAHEKNGAFPTVKDGTAAVALMMRPISPPAAAPERPHFIDGTLRTVSARLAADKATPAQAVGAATLTTDPAFFLPTRPRELDLDSVVPIRLEVRALGPGATSSIRNGRSFPLKLPAGPGAPSRTVNCPTICVDVAPADSLQLQVWANRTPEAFQANPWVAALNATAKSSALGLKTFLEPGAAFEALYSGMVREQRVAPLSDFTTIQLEHPVNQPLQPPSVVAPLEGYRVNDAGEWRRAVDEGNVTDQVNASKVYVTGRIHIDRKSTGEVWAEAFWIEVASKGRVFRNTKEEVLGRVEQPALFERKTPLQMRRLFSIPALDLPAPMQESAAAYLRRIDVVDLLLQDPLPHSAGTPPPGRTPRYLSAEFDCDQHRTLAVRLVARSRFAPADKLSAVPPGSEPVGPPEDTTYLKQSATREACRAALEDGRWDGIIPIKLLATRRPPAPYVTRDKGTFYQRVLRPSADGKETELVHVYRCWLDGDWFASGEGEKLAIVCKRPGAPELPDWARAQVSRWGGDGTSVPGQTLWMRNDLSSRDATYLLAEQIGGVRADETVLPQQGNDPASVALVALACLEPQFHTGYGCWYCDIELKPTGAYKAFVTLVLARFQKDALPGQHLSTTVPIDAVLMHQPWRFSLRRMGSTIEVTATGPAYRNRAPMLAGMDGVTEGKTLKVLSDLIGDTQAVGIDELPQAPLVIAELERLDAEGSGPMPVLFGGFAVVVTSLGMKPQRVPTTVESFSQPVMMSRWTLTLQVPLEDSDKRLAVRVSLASAHANSQARHPRQRAAGVGRDGAGFQPSALDGELIYLPEPIVVQIPVPRT